MVDQYFETADGMGKLLAQEIRHGCTYVQVEGHNFSGWYPLSTVAALEDHTERLLAELPESGANLPWNPSPRYRDFDTTTIEPIHELPENLDETNSTRGIRNYPDMMEPFPGDHHKFTTPYHAALHSIADIVNPEEHNDSTSVPEIPRDKDHHKYVGDPYDESIFDHDFIGENTEPTTDEWGTPASMTWEDQNNIVGVFQRIRQSSRGHFATSSDNPHENRAWAEDDHTPFEGHEAGDDEFEDPKDFDFKLGDFSTIQDQHWDDLASAETLNHPFVRDEDRFDRKSVDGESADAEVNPKESSFDFLANKYIKEQGGKWVITQKGTGDVLSHHDSREEAEKSFSAMMMNKHGEIKENSEGFFVTLPGGQKAGPFPTRAAAETAEGELEGQEDEKGKEKEERDKEREERAQDREREKREAGVHETPEGFFATGIGGKKQGPFPTRPAAEEAESSMGGVTADTIRYNPYANEPQHPGTINNAPQWPGHDTDHWPQKDHDAWPTFDHDIWPQKDQDPPPSLHEVWPQGDQDKHHHENLPLEWHRYLSFLDSDHEARTAAWVDVRQKALRLRREGAVDVLSFNPYEIKARVKGDSGTYGTVVTRKNAWGQGITWYDCSCPWGQWAYKRERSYVGRLCSHALAAYYEMQSLHNTKDKRSIEGSLLSNGTEYRIGDPVRVTEYGTVSAVTDQAFMDLVPGDTGFVTSIVNSNYVGFRMDHFGQYDPDLMVSVDFLEKNGFINYSEIETNDDSEHNPTDAGAFTLDVPGIIEGYESEASQALDSPTASFIYEASDDSDYGNDVPHHHDPDGDHRLEVFSQDPDGPSDKDRLRTLTRVHWADATADDEMSNPSLDEQTPPPEATGGPASQGTISALAWLKEESTDSYTDGFDPATVVGIQKNSAKNYSLMEQYSLMEEPGMAEEVDHLNLKDSFYENS